MSITILESDGSKIDAFIRKHSDVYISIYYSDSYDTDITEKRMIVFLISCSLGIIIFLSIMRIVIIKIEKYRCDRKRALEKVIIKTIKFYADPNDPI